MKRWMLLTLTLTLTMLVPSLAAAAEEGQAYVIRKGDTLWGISERFLKDPYYWPNLWANNPDVTNPHFIYPGQTVMIYDGRIEIVPASGDIEAVLSEAGAEPGAPVPAVPSAEMRPVPVDEIVLKGYAGGEGFVTTAELERAGTIVDTVDNRYMLAAGDTAFVTFTDLAAVRPGQKYTVFRTSAELKDPRTGALAGYRIADLGVVEIRQLQPKLATAEIVRSFREIQRGDRLMAYQDGQRVITLKKAPARLSGKLLAGREDKAAFAEHDFIYLDLGAADGLEEGNIVYISRPRQATELAEAQNLELPERLLGAAVVIKVQPVSATALVLKSADAFRRGDRVFTPD